MDFKALEDSAVARLLTSPDIPRDARVISWPDSPSSTGLPTGNGLIVVRFAGLSLSPPGGVDRSLIVQEGRIDLEVRTLSKGLRSHAGAYALLSIAQSLLNGWYPQFPAPLSAQHPGLYLASIDLVGRNSQIWDWGAMFNCNVILEKTL